MNPIIDPSIIYIMSVLHNLDMVCNVLFTFSIAGTFLCIIKYGMDYKYNDEDENMGIKKMLKCFFIAFCILLIPIIFIPSEKTMLAMLAASCITPDNIAVTEEHIVELVQKIVEAVAKTR